MSAQTFRSFFEDPDQQHRAFDAAIREGWLIPSGRLDFYDASRSAFDPSTSEAEHEAFLYFEKIHDELKGHWQVFRPHGSTDCCPAKKIFRTIKHEFAEFSWGGRLSLLNFPDERSRTHLVSSLSKMQAIKPNKGYPHMTVSKLLHFYNPGLFPIYDRAVIWGRVFRRFRNDFRDFCEIESISYDSAIKDKTATFLLNYMCWASYLLSFKHETFMQVFVDWLDRQPGTNLSKQTFDPATLYATAFEFIAIGAAPP